MELKEIVLLKIPVHVTKVKMMCPVCGDFIFDDARRLKEKVCNFNRRSGIPHYISHMVIVEDRS